MLPRPTKAVIATASIAGLIAFAGALAAMLRGPVPTADQLVVFAMLSGFVAVTWIWPLVMYRGTQSGAINLDEGIFVITALLLPFGLGVLVFAVALAVAQAARRRPLAKILFNWGQVVASAGAGLFVTRLIAPATPRLTVAELAAAALGALVFSAVNSFAVAAVVASLGTSMMSALRDGVGIRLRLVGSCIAVGTMVALALSSYDWSLPLAVVPMIILRQVLAGHFQARHDRYRLLGLFDAALQANQSLGEGDVMNAILGSARTLLRCSDATVSTTEAGPGQLGAEMVVNGETCWLVVSGRSRNEPFDEADNVLLEALAAVGAGALTNGVLYREVRFQRERLSAITSSLAEGVLALDESGSITFVNPAAARMLGWRIDSVEGRAAPAFLRATTDSVLRTRHMVRSEDAEFERADGSLLPVAFTASAIFEDTKVAGVVVNFRDISERREVEMAIRVARDQAIEASRLKSQFLANMSHEIRTPMNGVLGMSRLLLDTEVDDSQRLYLEAIRDSGENLMVILNDILDFSKIEAGKLALEEVGFDLAALLASVTNSMSVAARDKGLRLQLELDAAVPRQVRGDPIRLRQVVTNLVGNAIKFTHDGTVAIRATAPGVGRVRVEVIDSGIGIAPSARTTVLGAFGQADSSTTRRYGGTGLGLAICSQLVGMMGGLLDFTSEVGRGSTFWFEVPLAEDIPPAAKEPIPDATGGELSPSRIAGGDGPVGDRPRVLLVDDAPVDRLVASLWLERLGYGVDSVASGEEALHAVQESRYDAVLMDLRIGRGIDGYEATRRIRGLDGPAHATPIIAMTGSVALADREECFLAGMDAYLSKPLDPNLLAATLAKTAAVPVGSD